MNDKTLMILVIVIIVIVMMFCICMTFMMSSKSHKIDGGLMNRIPYEEISDEQVFKLWNDVIEKVYKLNEVIEKSNGNVVESKNELITALQSLNVKEFNVDIPTYNNITYWPTQDLDELILIIDEINSTNNDEKCFVLLKIIIITYYAKFIIPKYKLSFNGYTYETFNPDAKGHSQESLNTFKHNIHDIISKETHNYLAWEDSNDIRSRNMYFIQMITNYIIIQYNPLFIKLFGYNPKEDNSSATIGTYKFGVTDLGHIFYKTDNDYTELINSDEKQLKILLSILLIYICLCDYSIHQGDIKTDQFLIDENGEVQMLDFDLSEISSNVRETSSSSLSAEFYEKVFNKCFSNFNDEKEGINSKENKNKNDLDYIELVNQLLDRIKYIMNECSTTASDDGNVKIMSYEKTKQFIFSAYFTPISKFRDELIKNINAANELLHIAGIINNQI